MNYLKDLTLLPQLRGVRTAVVLDGEERGQRILFTPGMVLGAYPKKNVLIPSVPVLSLIPESCEMSIGGHRVFLEILDSQPRLIICGAGHVSLALIPLAKQLGFQVIVAEDREEYAKRAEEAGADPVYCMPFAEALSQIPGGSDAYFAVVTREHVYDEACLEQILPKESAYVGMMGSKGRTELVRKRLVQKGIAPQRVAQLHAPIGLDIGAQTPEEIALSILAQVISVYRKNEQNGYYSKAMLEASKKGEYILATIVEKEGSAPRSVGTKLLVSADGQVGTIGGGVIEADVLVQAREMLKNGEETRLVQLGILAGPEEELPVCGGRVRVLMEHLSDPTAEKKK